MSAKNPPETIQSNHSTTPKKPMPALSRINRRALLFGGIFVVAVAVLIAARAGRRTEVASVSTGADDTATSENAVTATQLETITATPPETTKATQPEMTTAVTSKPPQAAAVAKTSTTKASLAKAPAAATAKAEAVQSRHKAPAPELTRAASAAESTKAAEPESTTTAHVQNEAPMTITGCVEFDDARFWLKDTAGGEVPKSRSWKSGFLRKRPSSIQLVDRTHTLNLKTYVGRRVEATGMLVNREMRARSLQPVAASCN